MTVLNHFPIKSNPIGNETQTGPQEDLLSIKHQYSAGILKSLNKGAGGKNGGKELNNVLQESLPGPAESSLSGN